MFGNATFQQYMETIGDFCLSLNSGEGRGKRPCPKAWQESAKTASTGKLAAQAATSQAASGGGTR